MNPHIARLKELAGIDEKLKRAGARRREKQDAVKAAEQALADAKAHVRDRRGEIVRTRKEADALNLDVRTAEQEIEKLDAKLMQAKSNKEHSILQREINQVKGKQSDLEDGVLERLERMDTVTEEEKAGKARIAEAEKTLEETRKALESAEAELSKEEDALKEERGSVVAELDPGVRMLYERLLAQRGDSALARAVDGACSACARKLTPQLANLLDMGDEIVQCMSCNRILCLEED